MIYLKFSLLCFLAINSFFTFLKRLAQFDEAVEEKQYEKLSYIKYSGTIHFLFFLLFVGLIFQIIRGV